MDKYDLLVKLHQIRTSAVDENNQGLRDFIDEIFSSLTSDDFDKYDEHLSEIIARLTPRALDDGKRATK